MKTENETIEENHGLAVSLARRFFKNHTLYDFEDLLQVALMSMVKAYRKFDPERGKFSTFATYCMKNDLIKFVKKQQKIKDREVFLHKTDDKSYEVSHTIIELPPDLLPKEHGIYYYKKQNRKDAEIKDILNLNDQEYKKMKNQCFKKIADANE